MTQYIRSRPQHVVAVTTWFTRLQRTALVAAGCCILLGGEGCKDLTGTQALPAGTADPSYYNTAAGAIGMRNAAVSAFEVALSGTIADEGLLTDEFELWGRDPRGNGQFSVINISTFAVDQRNLIEGQPDGNQDVNGGPDQDYAALQGARALLAQAIGQLATYDTARADTATEHVLRGELYALEGYTEIMLADLFCSGIPLSTLDFQKDYTYAPSSTTQQVYMDAIAKFNTAIALASDSGRILNMARVGKGRAWLDIGQYDSAATAVATVPTNSLYQLAITWDNNRFQEMTESDREGQNGLPFRSSGDPRTATDTVIDNTFTTSNSLQGTDTMFFPARYGATLGGTSVFTFNSVNPVLMSAPYTLASGVEARLIEAEVALHTHPGDDTGAWLTILNQLRQTAAIPGTTGPAPSALPLLTDPGSTPNDSARMALLFAERAAWLFATGERQGDLRRLVRQNQWLNQQQVYPTGLYTVPSSTRIYDGFGQVNPFYGTYVNAPIPAAELTNPLFHGCKDRGA